MLIILSPAKSLDYKTAVQVKGSTLPEFVSESAKLIADLKQLAPQDVAKLMGSVWSIGHFECGAISWLVEKIHPGK